MNTICQSCGVIIDTPYTLIGAATDCPMCGTRTTPRVQLGASYPLTGYEIKFSDFQQLLSDSAYRPALAPLLRAWFGYELEPAGEAVRIRARDGIEIDELSLHRRIQADSSQQYTFYQAAMTLWR